MSKKIKLTIELIPKTCHYSNVRSMVKPKEWDKIRFISYKNANNKCEICKQAGKDQGYKHDVECHEIWEYDEENKIQKLAGLITLCPTCHLVKHIGRAIAMGRQQICFTKLNEVNNWTLEQITEHIDHSFVIHKERSKHQWILDISLLNEEPYSLNLTLGGKRKFNKATWKKKKRKVVKRKTPRGKRPKKTKKP